MCANRGQFTLGFWLCQQQKQAGVKGKSNGRQWIPKSKPSDIFCTAKKKNKNLKRTIEVRLPYVRMYICVCVCVCGLKQSRVIHLCQHAFLTLSCRWGCLKGGQGSRRAGGAFNDQLWPNKASNSNSDCNSSFKSPSFCFRLLLMYANKLSKVISFNYLI